MKRKVTAQRGDIVYELEYKKVKNVNLRVRRDGSVYVSAHPAVSLSFIDGFVSSRAEFILDAIDRAKRSAEQSQPTIDYVSGDRIPYLGGMLTLRVTSAPKNAVYTEGDELVLALRSPTDTEGRRRLLANWCDGVVRAVVSEICREVYPAFAERGIAYPEIKFRNMRSQWGNCHARKGVLTFSYMLIGVPRVCIEYVVMHEFAHFIHPDHSPAFHNEMTRLMPNWRERQRMLKSRVF